MLMLMLHLLLPYFSTVCVCVETEGDIPMGNRRGNVTAFFAGKIHK